MRWRRLILGDAEQVCVRLVRKHQRGSAEDRVDGCELVAIDGGGEHEPERRPVRAEQLGDAAAENDV